MKTDAAQSWTSFWDTNHSVYVSPRHLDRHYQQIAADIIRVLPHAEARVLDYGCGEALHASRIAAACGDLLLCDAAPNLRARLTERFAGQHKIHVMSPADVDRLPESSVDLVVANSLVQYLRRDELADLLATWRGALSAGGCVIVADVITPEQTALADASALLRFAAANGFLVDAVSGLTRTLFSDYRKLRARLGLTRYAPEDILSVMKQAGFSAEPLQPNFGYNDARLAVIGIKQP